MKNILSVLKLESLFPLDSLIFERDVPGHKVAHSLLATVFTLNYILYSQSVTKWKQKMYLRKGKNITNIEVLSKTRSVFSALVIFSLDLLRNLMSEALSCKVVGMGF